MLEAVLKESFVCQCQGMKTNNHLSLMSEHKALMEKIYRLKLKIGTHQAFVDKVDTLLNCLKESFDEKDYEMFAFRHLGNNSLNATSNKFNYADASGSGRRIKKMEQLFEELISNI